MIQADTFLFWRRQMQKFNINTLPRKKVTWKTLCAQTELEPEKTAAETTKQNR